MKNLYLLFVALLTFIFASAQIVNIPDANFKNALVNTLCVDTDGDGIFDDDADTNDDGEIQVSEAEAVVVLWVPNNNIVSMEGIQSFVNLEHLQCIFNQINDLDVSQNTNLIILRCIENQLTNLDVSQNINLETLSVGGNQLTDLDVSQNSNLTVLSCGPNQLDNLDITQNTNLMYLYCEGNQLTNLDISQNTALKIIFCYNNQLTNLDVSDHLNLEELACSNNQLTNISLSQNSNLFNFYCDNNQLTNLDPSQCPNLRFLYCQNNQLSSLDVSQNPILEELWAHENQLTSLNINNGNNSIFSRMIAYENPDLTCIQVDDDIYANNQDCSFPLDGWCKDPWASYSEECELGIFDIELSSQINIYPNPVIDILIIDITSTTKITSIMIYDVLGRLVMVVEDDYNLIDVSHLNSGMLFVEIETDKGVLTKRIIKE